MHSRQDVGRKKMLARCFKKWKSYISILKKKKQKKNDSLFSLEPCFEFFGNGKYGLFLRQKVSGDMIFTGYWKVPVLSFSVMGNTVFFEAKSLWKNDIYWLLKSSCFELFRDENCGYGNKIFTDYWKVLVLSFSVTENTVFFYPKSWYKGNIYLVSLSFSWYSRTWEVRFFVQWFFFLNFLFLFVCVYFTVCVFMFHAPLHGQS